MEQKLQLAAENGNPDAQFNIALQHLDAKTEVHFRKIEIKELKSAP